MFEDDKQVPTIKLSVPKKELIFRNKDYRMVNKFRRKFFSELNDHIDDGLINTSEGLIEFKENVRRLLLEAIEKNEIFQVSKQRKKRRKIRNKKDPVTRGRLNRMMKWFVGKKIKTEYYYANSLGWEEERTYSGVVKSFNIIGQTENDYYPYTIEIIFHNNSMIQTIPRDAFFHGLGDIRWLNSGPVCSFKIKEI